jgi:DNA-binding GntR family transcriptional regulator
MNKTKLPSLTKPYQTKQEWVYATLKDAIQSCALAPGTRLTLDDLAEQLNVSRVPVREALLQLQVEGLVDMTPHAGAVVSPISLDSIHELFMILEELEVLAGRVTTKKASPKDLKNLEDMLTSMEEAIVEGDVERWSQLNTEFHREVSRLSGMPFLQQITEKALEKWDRMRRYFLTEVLHKRTTQAQEEHRQIYAALKEGNVEAVEQILRTHNRSALKAYLTYLSEEDPSRPQDSDHAE